MPKFQGACKTAVKKGKTPAEHRRAAVERQREALLRFECMACSHSVTRVRNVRIQMCKEHKLGCDTMCETETFPQPDSIIRDATAAKFAMYDRERSKKDKKATGPVANNIVYDDVSADNIPAKIGVIVDPNAIPLLASFLLPRSLYPVLHLAFELSGRNV